MCANPIVSSFFIIGYLSRLSLVLYTRCKLEWLTCATHTGFKLEWLGAALDLSPFATHTGFKFEWLGAALNLSPFATHTGKLQVVVRGIHYPPANG